MIKITDSGGKVLLETQGPITLAEMVVNQPPPTGWKVDFFGNLTLTGTPASTRYYDDLNFNWGLNKPIDEVGIDNFSVRATRTITTEAAWYAITVSVDDGVRVYVDGSLVIDAWKDQVATYTEKRQLAAGNHTFVVEFYEHGGAAKLQFSLEKTTAPVVEPPAPVTSTKKGVGVHILTNVRGWEDAYGKGCFVGTFMNRPMEACDYAQGDPLKWAPGCGYPLIFYRIYHDTAQWSAAEMVDQLAGLTGHNHPNKKNVVITLANEWDNGITGGGNSAEGMVKFCDWSIECIDRLHAKGFTNVAWLTSSMGTPDFTKKDLCDVIKAKIAPLWNSGQILWTDMHLYSPTKDFIYRGFNSVAGKMLLYTADKLAVKAGGPVGRNGAELAKQGIFATWDDGGHFPSIAPYDEIESPQWWFELRWKFLWTRCGFSGKAPGKVISTEMGVDEGGVGGMPAHQMSREEVLAYCREWLRIQALPLTVNGVSYPSPFVAGTIFQADPYDERWAGYRVNGYFPLVWNL